jgi:hypothetical protein
MSANGERVLTSGGGCVEKWLIASMLTAGLVDVWGRNDDDAVFF